MATHSSIFAWRIPWTEASWLQTIGSQRISHEWIDLAHMNILQRACNEVQDLLEAESSPVLDLVGSNQFMLYPQGLCHILEVVPSPLASSFSSNLKKGYVRHIKTSSFFFFNNFIDWLVFDCAGPSLLCGIFSTYREQGLLSSCSVLASHCSSFSYCELQALGQVGSVGMLPRLKRTGLVVVAYGLSCSAACGIFPDQGWNLCPLRWQADSLPLSHLGHLKTSSYCVPICAAVFWTVVIKQQTQ